MAIENEIKFILKPGAFVEALLVGSKPDRLEQHYLNDETRIRRISNDTTSEAVFTFKRKVDGKLVEVETGIEDSDYELLLKTVVSGLVKHRTSLDIDDEHWDFDLFETAAGRFVIAEVEMPDGRSAPLSMPAFVKGHLVLEAGTDPLWTNAQLSKPGRLEEACRYVSEAEAVRLQPR